MKLRSALYSLSALALLATACKSKTDFTINGTVKNPGQVTKIFLLQADTTQVVAVDSANLGEDGKFQFKRATPFANLYKLRIGESGFDLIAQNGDDIDFSTDLNDKAHVYDVKGSDESEKLKELNKITNTYIEKNNQIVAQYQAFVQQTGKQSDSLMKVLMPGYIKNLTESGNAILDFAKKNENSLAAFYGVSTLDPMRFEKDMIAYGDVINGKEYFKGNPSVTRFVQQMLIAKPISIGHKAPDFDIAGIDGKAIKLADYKGKYVMLDFWASWCGPCRAENPNVVKQYNAYKDKGFNILGISLDSDKDAWAKAIADDKLTWAHGSDLKRFEGPTEALYHIMAIPSNFIIDPQGIIVAKNVTGADLEAFLNKTFNKVQ